MRASSVMREGSHGGLKVSVIFTFFTPGSVPTTPRWPDGTRINPDTNTPYSAMVVQENAAFTTVTVICSVIMKEASPTRPQADTLNLAQETSLVANASGNDGEPRKGAVLAAITALKQICNHPAAYEDDAAMAVQGLRP